MLDYSERKVLVTCLFVASCVCCLPGEFATGGAMLALTVVCYAVHRKITAREAAASAAERGSRAPPDAGT
jgi:hypothetical protein